MSDLQLPLAKTVRFGAGATTDDGARARRSLAMLVRLGFDSTWAPDHIAFHAPVSDPLTQIAYAGALAPELIFGTGVYLLPLRNPVWVAKMVATIDRLLGRGRFIFGIGVGGEYPPEFQASGIPLKERGARTNESLALLKRLWTGEEVEHHGRFFNFDAVRMKPVPLTPGGPPIWIGGRSEAALKRAAALADGWMPYVITPQRYAEGLQFIERHAASKGRRFDRFGTALSIFCSIGESVEQALEVASGPLSRRYAMDFREAARRYGLLGRPADVASRIGDFHRAGVREFIVDIIAEPGGRAVMLERFAHEVIPLVRGL